MGDGGATVASRKSERRRKTHDTGWGPCRSGNQGRRHLAGLSRSQGRSNRKGSSWTWLGMQQQQRDGARRLLVMPRGRQMYDRDDVRRGVVSEWWTVDGAQSVPELHAASTAGGHCGGQWREAREMGAQAEESSLRRLLVLLVLLCSRSAVSLQFCRDGARPSRLSGFRWRLLATPSRAYGRLCYGPEGAGIA